MEKIPERFYACRSFPFMSNSYSVLWNSERVKLAVRHGLAELPGAVSLWRTPLVTAAVFESRRLTA